MTSRLGNVSDGRLYAQCGNPACFFFSSLEYIKHVSTLSTFKQQSNDTHLTFSWIANYGKIIEQNQPLSIQSTHVPYIPNPNILCMYRTDKDVDKEKRQTGVWLTLATMEHPSNHSLPS